MKLKNMKIDKEAKKKMMEPIPSDVPEYPWGLRLELNNESLEKLGLEKLPKVGTSVKLYAKVDVVSVSAYEQAKGEKNKNLSLQITDLCLESGEKEEDGNKADILFGE